ncbi:hypothetical protein [Staphylococcus rostri]|uniref:Uncharacterized protein n=1 Tax=Staphylococcus rostri TaxID=522262 RepID=A0A2K3YXT1_9STAP|nr:hypothetical protein [Staphylococcus rostri]PNZ30416.1 hypothetical protein CD122_00010 [Staphylococcus rostri]
MRKDIRKGVKEFMKDETKPSYASLARRYNCDYRTVKQAFQDLENDNHKKKKQRGWDIISSQPHSL